MTDTKTIRNVLLLMLAILAFVVLKQLSSLLLPLVLAALLTVLSLPLVKLMLRWRFPRVLILPITVLLVLGILVGAGLLVGSAFRQFADQRVFIASRLEARAEAALAWAAQRLPGQGVDGLRSQVLSLFSSQKIASLIGTAAGRVGSFGGSTLLFLVYYVLLLSGASRYQDFVTYVSGGNEGVLEVWEETQRSISAYMGIKTLMSVLTGVLAGSICRAFSLPFALFWGFLTFLLNYIPSIGSIVAMIVPVLMAVVQFDEAGRVIGLAVSLIAVQLAVGNFLDPMIMGSRLRLNTVTVIFGLLFWGWIWGVPGMLLSVPLMVILRLLLERSPDLRILARVMGNPPRSDHEASLVSRLLERESPGALETGRKKRPTRYRKSPEA